MTNSIKHLEYTYIIHKYIYTYISYVHIHIYIYICVILIYTLPLLHPIYGYNLIVLIISSQSATPLHPKSSHGYFAKVFCISSSKIRKPRCWQAKVVSMPSQAPKMSGKNVAIR